MKALVLALLLATPALATPALATPADETAIRAHGVEWVKAFKSGDIEALMALYTPDAEVALHGKPKLKGIAAIRGYFTPLLKTPLDADFLLAEESLVVDHDTAVFMSKYWFTIRTPQGEIHVYDALGNFMWMCPLFSDDSTARVAGISWYNELEGLAETGAPSIAIAFDTGRVQLMTNEQDEKPILMDTGLKPSVEGNRLTLPSSTYPKPDFRNPKP